MDSENKMDFSVDEVKEYFFKGKNKDKKEITKEEMALLEYCHNMMDPERIKNGTDLMSMLREEFDRNPIEIKSDVDQETPNIIIKGKYL